MINDAHMGKFKLIITKEVSRFSRNILDTISYTRELRQFGVGVLFMNDGISWRGEWFSDDHYLAMTSRTAS